METRHLTRLQTLNRVLLAGSGFCILFMLFQAIRPTPVLDLDVGPAIAGAARTNRYASPNETVQLADLARRNLFKSLIAPPPPPKVVVQARPTPPLPPRVPLSQRVAHLKLVGIVNTSPLQAIIETQRDQKTLSVAAGQSIDNVQVEKVTADQVILSSGDERFSLTL